MANRILILRLDAIGDFVLFSGALPHLRKMFPQDEITLALHSAVAPIAEQCPYVDNILPIDRARFRSDIEYTHNLTASVRGKFDVAINTMYTRTEVSDNIIARTHAPQKIGFECTDKDGAEGRRLQDQIVYTDLIRSSAEWIYEIERYAQLLGQLGIVVSADKVRPELWIQKTERERAEALLKREALQEKKFMIVCPGAGFATKLWSSESFARTADAIAERHGMKVVFIGSTDDRDLVDSIRSQMTHPAITLAGQLGLREFAALTSYAGLYVGLDTAGFHLAWTSGIPTVGIFGGGHFGRFIPSMPNVRIAHVLMDCYHCYWHCIYDEVKCMTSITPEIVLKEVDEVLHARVVVKAEHL